MESHRLLNKRTVAFFLPKIIKSKEMKERYLCTALLQKIPCLTVRKLMTVLMAVMCFGFAWITLFDVPVLGIVVVFIAANSLTNYMMPLINAFGIET